MKLVFFLFTAILTLGCCCVFPDQRGEVEKSSEPVKTELEEYKEQWSKQQDIPPESLDQEEARKRKERMPEVSSWDGIARPVSLWMRRNLHDFGSASIVSASQLIEVQKGVFEQRVRFRARNAVGAMVLTDITFRMTKDQVISARENR